MAAGYKVGVYSSPHPGTLYRAVACKTANCQSLHIRRRSRKIERRAVRSSLTYFEYGTLSALWLFKQAQLDVVILEVGLAGVWMPPIWWMPMGGGHQHCPSIILTGWAPIGKYWP